MIEKYNFKKDDKVFNERINELETELLVLKVEKQVHEERLNRHKIKEDFLKESI